jgi:chemotaxis protein methyltransferase CheR
MRLSAWSIGSASGEEPYTLAILWRHLLAPRFPEIQISILGTEIDPYLLERSHRACYASATLKNLPDGLRAAAFTMEADDDNCLKPQYQAMVGFRQQDIRTTLPDESFDLIFCRNLVFTYFEESQQRRILQRILSRLLPGGWLVLGVHEKLPAGTNGLQVVSERLGLYHSGRWNHL